MNVFTRFWRWLLAPRNAPNYPLNVVDREFQARSDIAAQRHRAEEEMWRAVYQRQGRPWT